MKSLIIALIVLAATTVYAKEPISQSKNEVDKYLKSINAVAKGIDPTKGTVIDRIIKVYKAPADKLGYDFDKSYRQFLVDGIVNMSLYNIIVRISDPIDENKDEALSKKLITDKTYQILKYRAAISKASNIAKTPNGEMQKVVIEALVKCVDSNAGVCTDKKLEVILHKHPMFSKFDNPVSLANELSRVEFQMWGTAGLITKVSGEEINTNAFFNEGDEEVEFKIDKDLIGKMTGYKNMIETERKALSK